MEEEQENIPPTQDFFQQNFMTPEANQGRKEPPRIERQRIQIHIIHPKN